MTSPKSWKNQELNGISSFEELITQIKSKQLDKNKTRWKEERQLNKGFAKKGQNQIADAVLN